MKEPPTRIRRGELRIWGVGRWKYWAGGLGDFWTASSMWPGVGGFVFLEGMAEDGGEVMVKPPALGMPGMKVSSHWPGRNCDVLLDC